MKPRAAILDCELGFWLEYQGLSWCFTKELEMELPRLKWNVLIFQTNDSLLSDRFYVKPPLDVTVSAKNSISTLENTPRMIGPS